MSDYNTSSTETSICGCCSGRTVATPLQITNRPGLTAVAYRIGTHATFKESMLAQLSRSEWKSLNDLRTRDDSDFTIALIDGWATVADVLTFYMERLANEFYLRTATDRRSIIDLARLIGYRINPGVSAEVLLAFSLNDMTGSPETVTIKKGSKIQSVPGEDEKAQMFETIEDFSAKRTWNAIPFQTFQETVIERGLTYFYLKGDDVPLKTGDGILIVGQDRTEKSAGSERWDFRIVSQVEPDHEKKHTKVTWQEGLGDDYTIPASVDVKVFGMRTRASLFGHNAPDPNTLDTAELLTNGLIKAKTGQTFKPYIWKNFSIQGGKIDLDAEYKETVIDSWIVIDMAPYDSPDGAKSGETELYRVEKTTSLSRSDFGISAKITSITPDTTEHLNAFDLRQARVFIQSEELFIVEEPMESPVSTASDRDFVLDGEYDDLSDGQAIVVNGKDAGDQYKDEETKDIPDVSEVVEISGDPVIADGQTRITVDRDLDHSYIRDTARINANVTGANHGEIVKEYLGSGDSRLPYQAFALSATPLTYVAAATSSGSSSTLKVLVDDVEWQEVSTLYGRGPTERVFVTRIADDGTVTVQFGDGLAGARLPTGQNNVRAEYRKGIGQDGNVNAGQLSLLMTRPLGLKDVINPADAEGGDDPEVLDDARQNAPLTVLTMDRVVSLQDYEDYARAFAGVHKASACRVWDGARHQIVVTVAGPDGDEIDQGSTTRSRLWDALSEYGVPNAVFELLSFDKKRVHMKASLVLDSAYVWESVIEEIETGLRDTFSFSRRDFAQPLWASEVIAVIQSVAGVLAVDLDEFYREGDTPDSNDVLEANGPVFVEEKDGVPAHIGVAQMVMVDDDSKLDFQEKS